MRARAVGCAVALLLLWTGAAAAAGRIFVKDGAAIRGYDPVAYFVDGRPEKGDPAFAADWRGARWLFATAEHRDRFLAAPERYAPRYGGFCAWAMSQGYLAQTMPEAFRIIDGRLYLLYSPAVLERWEPDATSLIPVADRNWQALAR